VDVELVVVEDEEAAARAAAERLAAAARRGGHIVLSGGSTPMLAYELAAELQGDWTRCDLWLGDERCVPHDDERSNARLVRESLLAGLARGPRAIHLVRTELPADEAADAYAAELERAPSLALALMGIGPDGHTASLFPGAPALDERRRLVVAAAPGLEPWVERVTLTIPAFAGASDVLFLAVGEKKAEAAKRAFVEPPSKETPASLVRSAEGRTTAILDEAAAALLSCKSEPTRKRTARP
jgi:6-phosphogluconolactonase